MIISLFNVIIVKISVNLSVLSKKSDFALLSKEGKKKYFKFGTVIYRFTQDNSGFRLGFAVSKRLGNAVLRNKIKRRVRSAITEIIKDKTINCDMLFIAKPKAADVDFKEMVGELNFCTEL